MFEHLLGREEFEFQTWAVLDNKLPESATQVDGWLITGSRHGVYEDHRWIPPLEKLIQAVYAAKIPLIGVCFGHQIIAQALGGQVKKFDGGWSVGHVDYMIDNGSEEESKVGVHAFHQDQIINLPPEAHAYGSTDFCQYAFVRYKGPAMTVQPHPEFTDQYLLDLITARGKVLPPEIVEAALKNVGQPLATQSIAEDFRQFFLDHGPQKQKLQA